MQAILYGHTKFEGDRVSTATRAISHPRLQCNFQKLLHCHRAKNLQPGYTVQWQSLLLGKLPEYVFQNQFSIFLQLLRSFCIASARHATHRNLYVRQQCNNFLKLDCHRKENIARVAAGLSQSEKLISSYQEASQEVEVL